MNSLKFKIVRTKESGLLFSSLLFSSIMITVAVIIIMLFFAFQLQLQIHSNYSELISHIFNDIYIIFFGLVFSYILTIRTKNKIYSSYINYSLNQVVEKQKELNATLIQRNLQMLEAKTLFNQEKKNIEEMKNELQINFEKLRRKEIALTESKTNAKAQSDQLIKRLEEIQIDLEKLRKKEIITLEAHAILAKKMANILNKEKGVSQGLEKNIQTRTKKN